MDPGRAENRQIDDADLELAIGEAVAVYRAYSEPSDYQGLVERFWTCRSIGGGSRTTGRS